MEVIGMKFDARKIVATLLFTKQKQCLLCGRTIPRETPALSPPPWNDLCPACLRHLLPIVEPVCLVCGREKKETFRFSPGKEMCRDCEEREETYFIMNRSALHYSFKGKEWLYAYKYKGREQLVEGLIHLLYQTYRRHYSHRSIEAITFVPLYEDRLQQRTFNQAEQLAKGLGKRANLPVYDLLERHHPTRKQSRQTRQARLHALEGAFGMKEEIPHAGNKILLIDDVYTTGSTVNECSRVLREGGWEEVYILTPFRA